MLKVWVHCRGIYQTMQANNINTGLWPDRGKSWGDNILYTCTGAAGCDRAQSLGVADTYVQYESSFVSCPV